MNKIFLYVTSYVRKLYDVVLLLVGTKSLVGLFWFWNLNYFARLM